MNFFQILEYSFAGNTLEKYLIAGGVLIMTIILIKLFKSVVVRKIRRIGEEKDLEVIETFVKIVNLLKWPFHLCFSLWVGSRFLYLSNQVNQYFSYILLIVAAYYMIRILQALVDVGMVVLAKKKRNGEKGMDHSIVSLLGRVIKITLWIVIILILLQNLGFKVTTLIAGLGIGGVAIAFALQGILTDVFSCFSIYFDKPFETGDFIAIGKETGMVKKIGIQSTRLQTLQGEELVVPNQELVEKSIKNYRKMKKRRIEFSFGVVYDTSAKKLEKIPDMVKDIMKEIESIEIDRVHFSQLGESALIFKVVYYMLIPDYGLYMDAQQEINLALKKKLEKEGINFAYPTQTILLSKKDARLPKNGKRS
jgi:small-conductance mechanosensitive channel